MPLECCFFFVPVAVSALLSDSAAPAAPSIGIKTESSVGLLSLCTFADKAPFPLLPQGICCKGIKPSPLPLCI